MKKPLSKSQKTHWKQHQKTALQYVHSNSFFPKNSLWFLQRSATCLQYFPGSCLRETCSHVTTVRLQRPSREEVCCRSKWRPCLSIYSTKETLTIQLICELSSERQKEELPREHLNTLVKWVPTFCMILFSDFSQLVIIR